MDNLQERLKGLAQLQRDLETAEHAMDAAYDEHVRPLLKVVNDLTKVVKETEEEIKRDCLTHFLDTGEVKFHDRVVIVRNTRLIYDPVDMLLLAKLHQPDLVKTEEKLKVRDFENLAKSEEKPDWVVVESVPAPTIRLESLDSMLD